MRDQLQREQTSVAEFHCLMVRADIFDRIGAFDESMLTVLENLDFCLAVARVPPHHRPRLPASERQTIGAVNPALRAASSPHETLD